MTKIMAIGDVHGDAFLIANLAKKAVKEKIEIIILTGDMTYAETSLDNLIGPFAKEKKKVLILPGHHESAATTEFLAQKYAPYAHHLHGEGFIHKDIGIFGAGTANMGIHAIPDSSIFELIENSHKQIIHLKKKVLVTHIHPKGSKSELTGFAGSPAVKQAIEKFKPKLAISSHIHEASGLEEKIGETLVINVSKKEFIFEI